MVDIIRDDGGEITGSAMADLLTGLGAFDYLVSGLAGSDTITTDSGDDTIDADAGNDSVSAGDGDDLLNLGVGNDVGEGGDGNDTILGSDGGDDLFGGSGNDSLNGGTENDTLVGGAGDDRLEGGFGFDVAVFSADFALYDFYRFGDPDRPTIAVTGPDGEDWISGIDQLDFADRDVAIGDLVVDSGLPVEDAQTVAYLYEAALDRIAQFAGLNYWIDRREAGMTEVQLSTAFLKSPEFETNFGNAVDPSDPDYLDDVAFVSRLYENVLDRPPGEEGLDFWLDRLDDPGVTRAHLLISFAVSEENMAGSTYVESLTEIAPGDWDFV